MTLRSRLLALALPIAALSVAAMTLLARRAVVAIIVEQVSQRASSVADSVARQPGLPAALRRRDEAALLQELQGALRGGALYAAAQDSDGLVIAHTNVVETGKVYPPLKGPARRDLPRGPVMEVASLVRPPLSGPAEELFLLGGEKGGPPPLGSIRVGMPLAEGLQTAAFISRRVGAAIAAVSLVTVLIGILLLQTLAGRLAALAAATRRLSEGRFGELVPESGRDEIGQLAARFNEMSRALARTTVSKEFLDGILINMADAVVVTEPDGAIALVNHAAESMLGPAGGLLGRPVASLFSSGGEPFAARALLALPPERGLPDLEAVVAGVKDPVPVLSSAGRVPLRGGRGPGFVVTLKDITARKAAEEALSRYADDLSRSNAELEQFAYVASHDLQEPLRKVSSYCQLLQRRYQGKLDADADQFINYAVDGATRMKRLIDDLLAYSRLTRKEIVLSPIELRSPVDRAVENLELAIKDAGGRVELAPLPRVLGDVPLLTQVFQNLIGNALKFRGETAPLVTISAAQEAGLCVVTVRDNGIGIDPKYFDRLFQIFQRLHTRREFAGSGIGLSVCRKIVERHGGRIWVESQAGHGSAFRFTLKTEEGA